MSGQDAVLRSVLEVLADIIPGAPVLHADTDLLTTGLLDSLGIVTAINRLEQQHDVQLPPEALNPDTFARPAALAAVLADAARQSRS
ncbi:acyl carrier protein [Catellatospora sp. NPDC049111]|uniref:acyl carrier protein n=1 Tax=Catellatospora sp. NPDC049111 TaxID=3155271 RepID=UPI0034075631